MSFFPTSIISSSATLTDPIPSIAAIGISPIIIRATCPTVVSFLTSTQSGNTEVPPSLLILRTGYTGTRFRTWAAACSTCTTPVEPNRYRTKSRTSSTRLVSYTYHIFQFREPLLTVSTFHLTPSNRYLVGRPWCPKIRFQPRSLNNLAWQVFL
jgi:hypothetical protein